jgi:UPF0716 protein FxsA
MWLLLIFILVPIIEIGLFIQVGGAIGLWPTLLIVVLTAVLGTTLVRQQGALAMSQLRGSFGTLSDPSEPLAHGAMILFSGALLLTPGFFTDAFGFLLLVPAFRSWTFTQLSSRIKMQSFSMGGGMGGTQDFSAHSNPREPHAQSNHTIEAEYEEILEPKDDNNPPSGWTQH